MRSAYAILGIPGNAGPEEIREAYEKAAAFYTPEKIAAGYGVVDKFNELKVAYDVLRDPESRLAHDRKLNAQRSAPKAAPRVTITQVEESPGRGLLMWGMVLVAVLFAAGMFVNWRNAEARREQARLELVARQQAEREEEKKRQDALQLEAERAAAKVKAEAEDRRIAHEGQNAANRASYERVRSEANALQAQRMATAEAQRQEAAAAAQERRNAMEARMRVEADKRRIRELCLQQYRRVDC